MKREKTSSTAQAVGRSGRTDCWPLPPEWDQVIPPQAVIHRHVMLGHGISFSGPEWNMDWLRGLEAFIRSVVQDEIRKANVPAETRRDSDVVLKPVVGHSGGQT